MTKIRDAPNNLCLTIPVITQRQDRVSVSLRDRITVTRPFTCALFISQNDELVCDGMMLFQPGQKRWSKVETNMRVVVDANFANRCSRICRVTFGVNALVPIMIRCGTELAYDFACP